MTMSDHIKTDVLVVGAGAAGIPAAIAAARAGAKVVLIEEDLHVGGAPTDMFVTMFCGDTIAIGTYGLDIWGRHDLAANVSHVPAYGLPYRALIPKATDGLLLSGKAISGTHIAMSAYRVMPIAGSIGQAAGVAAAICARRKQQPREIDPQEIQGVLRGKQQRLQLDVPEHT